MMRARWAALAALLPAIARADAPPPPATPTVYLAIYNRGTLKLPALQAAVKVALGGLAKGFSLSLVGGAPQLASPALTARDAKRILSEVARAAASPSESDSAAVLMIRASNEWTGPYGATTPRHHLVLVTDAAVSASELSSGFTLAANKGFTASLLSLRKRTAAELKELETKGAGRARVVSAKTLAAALRAELAWGKLSKADEKKLVGARTSKLLGVLGRAGGGGGGLIGVLRSSGGAVGSAKLGGLIGGSVGGVGGLGLRGRGYGYGSSARFRRGEALIGQKLALAFREVTCRGGCDVAEVRRAWLQSAGPLLSCLEGSSSLGGGELSVELGATGKAVGSGAAASCAASWYAKQARSGVSAKLLVGPASSVP